MKIQNLKSHKTGLVNIYIIYIIDEAKIADPESVKPEGYDDIPITIVDPNAEKPQDWDDDMDGDWEAPKIANPEYKGPWKAKVLIACD